MENVIHMDPPERPDKCACEGSGPSLAVLQEVQRAYEQRMDMLERVPGTPINRLQLKVDLLRSWVADLVGQNTLLARAVEELEAEATTRLFMEERKHNEMVCELRAELAVFRRRLVRKDSDLRGLIEVLRRLREFDFCTLEGIHFCEVTESDIFGSDDWQHKMAQGDAQHNKEKRGMCGKVNELKTLNESLHKENIAQDRELRKLRKDIHQLEQMVNHLKSEISLSKYCTPNVSKKDAEVMAGMCCTGAECGDWEPVKDFNSVLREEMVSYQERMQKFDLKDVDLKPSGNDVRALRKANLALREQLHSVCTVCAALSEQCRAAVLRGQLKDDIIREMRRQLKHAKAKSKEAAELISIKSRSPSRSRSRLRDAYDSVTIACVRQQPRRRSRDTATLGSRDSGPQESQDAVERPLPPVAPRSLSPDDGRSPRLVVSGDDLLSFSAE